MLTRSRAFKDISLSFKRHPVTNDIISLTNEDSIKQSVKNIVKTIFGEKPFVPNFGSNANDALFELTTDIEFVNIQEQIRTSLANFEPRVNNVEILVDIPQDSHELEVRVQYDIVGLPIQTQNVEFILQTARI